MMGEVDTVISSPVRVFARKTIVREIDVDTAQSFIDNNHRSGSARPNSTVVSIGLFSDDELVAVAQFCSPRTAQKKREYTTELLRLAFKNDYVVVGGASKLIQYYIRKYEPIDIFTYQDTTGKNSTVYEKSGFRLVGQDKVKKYLVAPGKTIISDQINSDQSNTAQRKEYFTVATVASLGPDALLKTNLGEVFRTDTMKRKTNIELFIEELGWHIEETTGDKTYEWVNPDVTFYTYKITATDSNKYYYGMSHVKKANATVDECVNDGYFGSGGKHSKNNKFVNWKKKHKDNFHKEITETFDRKYKAYDAERKLVGDLYKTDPLCLNSIAGGRYTGIANGRQVKFTDQKCIIHGVTKHMGDTCCRCTAEKSLSVKKCEIHGNVKHVGDVCRSCLADKNISLKVCEFHGETKHSKDRCCQCANETIEITLRNCSIHGESKHIGGKCHRCVMAETVTMKECVIHGLTKHKGDTCSKCAVVNSINFKKCPIHGETKYIGSTCSQCNAEGAVNMRECLIHGMTKHVGTTCSKCRASNNVSFRLCAVHGETKHVGDKCYKCRGGISMKKCSIHGETKHLGDACRKCISDEMSEMKECSIHGIVKHMGGHCINCRGKKAVDMKKCEFHGLTKHRGKACYQCMSEKGNHTRLHKDTPNEKCRLCEKATN